MSYADLCNWVQEGDIGRRTPEEILALLDSALLELEEDDPRYQALVDIEAHLLSGVIPVDRLQQLVDSQPVE